MSATLLSPTFQNTTTSRIAASAMFWAAVVGFMNRWSHAIRFRCYRFTTPWLQLPTTETAVMGDKSFYWAITEGADGKQIGARV